MDEALDTRQLRLAVRMAAALSRALVPLNPEALRRDSRAPAFYCIHTITGGGAADFLELAGEIGEGARVFAVQAPKKLMNASDHPGRLECVADHHADAIVNAQPDGVLHLGGVSAGALVALETARRLKARGREVGLLVSIDGAPKNTRFAGSPLVYGAKILANLPRALWSDDLDRLRKQIRLKAANLLAGTRGRAARHPIHEVLADFHRYPPGQQIFMTNLYDSIEQTIFAPYDGEVVVYEARVKPILLCDVARFWRGVAARSEIVAVPGTHADVIRAPCARLIAADLKRRLAAADAARREAAVREPARERA
jgi:thioesterase domain-containing protein